MSLGGLAKVYQDIQQIRIGLSNKSWAAENAEGRAIPAIYLDMIEQLKDMEKALIKEAEQYLKHHPAWPWLKQVKGLGPTLAAQLLGYIEDISRFDNPSKLWKICGLGVSNVKYASAVVQDMLFTANIAGEDGNRLRVRLNRGRGDTPAVKVGKTEIIIWLAVDEDGEPVTTQEEVAELINETEDCPLMVDVLENGHTIARETEFVQLEGGENGYADRPVKGQRLSYNPRLKALCYNIGVSFIKTNSPYRVLYDQTKARYQHSRPDWTKRRIHYTAMRKMTKVFLANLWTVWRQAEGLPVVKEYAFDYLRHSQEDRYTPEQFAAQ